METSKQLPDMALTSLKNIIHIQLTKTSSIIALMLAANEHEKLEQSLAHGALWVVSDYLEDLQGLFERLSEQS